MRHRSRRGKQKLSGKRNEFGRRSGEQLELYRRSNLSGKRTEAEQMLKGMRSHPTYNEGIGEALEELEGGAIHVVPKKKK